MKYCNANAFCILSSRKGYIVTFPERILQTFSIIGTDARLCYAKTIVSVRYYVHSLLQEFTCYEIIREFHNLYMHILLPFNRRSKPVAFTFYNWLYLKVSYITRYSLVFISQGPDCGVHYLIPRFPVIACSLGT